MVGIREALRQAPDSDLGDEEVAAIFVAHSLEEEGRQRTRRLFATLNRYAKPVSKRDIIALDEDDVVAIVTRRLVEQLPLFEGRVSLNKSKALPKGDRTSLTSIVALYDCLDVLLNDQKRRWKSFKARRPQEKAIEGYYLVAEAFWSAMSTHFHSISDFAGGTETREPAAPFRHEEGGHLLFRPIGLMAYARATRSLVETGVPMGAAVERLARVPAELAEKPWTGLLFDASNRRMITAGPNQRVAARLLFLAAGGDEAKVTYSRDELKKEWAGLVNREPDEVSIPGMTRRKA